MRDLDGSSRSTLDQESVPTKKSSAHDERQTHRFDGEDDSENIDRRPPTDPDTQLIAFLDRDFVDPDARVRAIASPRIAALADC